MSGPQAGLAISVFLACMVEAVEALTIVLAVGVTRSWRSALTGVAAATVALAAITAALGPALTTLPINALRLVVGGLLLTFGLQWLRKAILRATGLKSLHDEEAAYQKEIEAARSAGAVGAGLDPYAFMLAFKGVLLEGLEVVFIVLTFGANQHDVGLAASAAGVAVALVVLAGLAAHAPLARVPENAMKFSVGVMLTAFGTFWGAEGAGAHWPGGDAALLALVPATLAFALAGVALLRRRDSARPGKECWEREPPGGPGPVRVGLRGRGRLADRGRSGARAGGDRAGRRHERQRVVDPAGGGGGTAGVLGVASRPSPQLAAAVRSARGRARAQPVRPGLAPCPRLPMSICRASSARRRV